MWNKSILCAVVLLAATHFVFTQQPNATMASLAGSKKTTDLSDPFDLLAFTPALKIVRDETFDLVSLEAVDPGHMVWRIEMPNVKQKTTAYPQIVLRPGDQVSVFADGCVQTGGAELTWKRYVDPHGNKSENHYHGLIALPGTPLVRIQQFGLDVAHTVPATAPPSGSLTLGYEDDGYGDNGYWGHDNGTQDQCKNSVNAFVIVAVSHPGFAALVPSTFRDIKPDDFRGRSGWRFDNPKTPRLSWATFNDAFNFSWTDYLDMTTYIIFLATRDSLASDGNCMGMSLLADMAERQYVAGDLHEDLWTNYPDRLAKSPNIMKDINTAHWEQLSVAFLHGYMENVVKSPEDNARQIEADLARADIRYGLISIAHKTDGHVLVPLRVTPKGGTTYSIDVYDPNRPYVAGQQLQDMPKIEINGSYWRYDMGGEIWSGSTANDGLAYIPFDGLSGWRHFGANLANVSQIVFGGGGTVEQVTDSSGRKLFTADGRIDAGPQGLGHSVFLLPTYGQGQFPPRRLPDGQAPLTLTGTLQETPKMNQQRTDLDREFASDYAGAGNMFIVNAADLSSLTFQIRQTSASRPVRMLVHGGSQFFEINTVAAGAGRRVALVIHQPAALATAGVSVQSLDAGAVRTAFTYGQEQVNRVRLQRLAPITSPQPVRVRAPDASLHWSAAGVTAPISLIEETRDASGRRELPAHLLKADVVH